MTARPIRILLAGALLGLQLLLMPSAALASGGPVLDSHPLFTEGFEGTLLPRTSLAWAFPTPGDPLPAYWGTITARKHSGTHGLWCAESIPASTTAGWTRYAGRYPASTAGIATFDAPELADYYSATLDFWYQMPSLGANDSSSFNVMWKTSTAPDRWESNVGLPLVASMTHHTFTLAAPTPDGATHPVNLSRSAATVRFLFIDDASAYESPSNGEGPTIDDVTVSGYKYGPVRNLAVVADDAGAHLSWRVPARSTALLAEDEERSITYRVYREYEGSNAWTELTGVRIAATSFDDTDTDALSGTYRYVVQAWDAGSGPGYGQVTMSGDSATHHFLGPASAPDFSITGIVSPSKSAVIPSYTVNSVETTAPTATATLDGVRFTMGDTVSAEGTHTLVVRLTGAGGTSERSVVFMVDKTPPVTTADAPTTLQFAAVTVTLSASDPFSGVAHTYYKLDTAASYSLYTGSLLVTSFKDHTLYYYSVDSAGNRELTKHVHFSMRMRTTLTITKSSTKATRNHSFTVYGYLAPAGSGGKITLKYQKPGSSHWYTVTRYTVKSGTRGKWTYKCMPRTKGLYHFKVTYAGSSTRYKSASPTLAVRVY